MLNDGRSVCQADGAEPPRNAQALIGILRGFLEACNDVRREDADYHLQRDSQDLSQQDDR